MNSLFSAREQLLLKSEIKMYFLQRRALHFVPLLIGGVFLMAWIYPVGSPFLPVIIVVILGLELQFNNIFRFRFLQGYKLSLCGRQYSFVLWY